MSTQPPEPGWENLPPPPQGYPPPPPQGYQPPPPPPPQGPAGGQYAFPPPAYGYQGYGAQPAYAGFGARLGAILLDGLLVGIPAALVIGGAFWALSTSTTCLETVNDFTSTTGQSQQLQSCRTVTGGAAGVFFLVWLVVAVLGLLYYIVPIGRRGQTVGKRIAGVKVVDATSGEPIGIGRSIGRYFMAVISGSVCYLGYLWMLWDPQKQTWHDKVVNSIVVRA